MGVCLYIFLISRKSIPLNKNEGIYVQDCKTGKVRSVLGPQSYMIKANEEMYAKHLEPLVEDLLKYVSMLQCTSVSVFVQFVCVRCRELISLYFCGCTFKDACCKSSVVEINSVMTKDRKT